MRCAEQTRADAFFGERESVYKKILKYVPSKTYNETAKENYSEIHIQLGEIYREGKIVNKPSLSERPKKYLEKWSKLLKEKQINFDEKEAALHYFEIIFNELVVLSAARLLSANLYYDVSSARCYAGANKVAQCLIEQVKANNCEDDFFDYFFEKFKVNYKIHCEESSKRYVSQHEFVCRMLFQAPAFYVWITNYVWSKNRLAAFTVNELNLLIELHFTAISSGFNPKWYKESLGEILDPLEKCFKYLEPKRFVQLWLTPKASHCSNLKTLIHLFSDPVLNPISLREEPLENKSSELDESEDEELIVVELGIPSRSLSYLSDRNIELVEYINQLLRFDEKVLSCASRDVLRRYRNRLFKSVSYLSLLDYELIVEVLYKYQDEKGISELIDTTSLLSMNFIDKLPKLRDLFSRGKLSTDGDLSFHLWILPELIGGSKSCLSDFRTSDCWHLSKNFMRSWHPEGVRLCDLNEDLVSFSFLLAEEGEFSSTFFYFCEVLLYSSLITEGDFRKAKLEYEW